MTFAEFEQLPDEVCRRHELRHGELVELPPTMNFGARNIPAAFVTPRSLVWVDRQGHEEAIPAPRLAYTDPRLSPDGTKIGVDSQGKEHGVWVFDLAKNTFTRLTSGAAAELHPIWIQDGKYLLFHSRPPVGRGDILRQAAYGTGAIEALTQHMSGGYPLSLSPGGEALVFRQVGGSPGLYLLPLDPKGDARVLIADPEGQEFDADLSPNGRWIAYDSAANGRREVYVRPFPAVNTGRWQVSAEGGAHPVWARSGRELFFTAARRMVVVPVPPGSSFSFGKPQPLFDISAYASVGTSRSFDISPDGKRFLMLKNAAAKMTASRPSIVVVSHWFDEVNRRVRASGK